MIELDVPDGQNNCEVMETKGWVTWEMKVKRKQVGQTSEKEMHRIMLDLVSFFFRINRIIA